MQSSGEYPLTDMTERKQAAENASHIGFGEMHLDGTRRENCSISVRMAALKLW